MTLDYPGFPAYRWRNVGAVHALIDATRDYMSDAMPEIEDRSAWDKLRTGYREFRRLLEAAFDELHSILILKVEKAGKFAPINSLYPRMSILRSGFPSFDDVGIYPSLFDDPTAPRFYTRLLDGSGLASLYIMDRRPANEFPRLAELKEFLIGDDVGRRFWWTTLENERKFADWQVDSIVSNAVERYLQLHGVGRDIDLNLRDLILRPMIDASVWQKKELRLVVPIALTHFDIDRLRLSDTTYLIRIPAGLQLARAQLKPFGSGAVSNVVGAATHAFVSNTWQLNVETLLDVENSLQHVSKEAFDTIDAFFGALRLVTGVKTGYAQALWLPKKWALKYSGDLPPVYGTTMRQYPDEFDNYGWARECHRVTCEELNDVRTLYGLITASDNNRIRLAIKRLNTCMTRTDDADAILDASIGLEILLNDDENQALSYKLRLRAGALCLIDREPELSATYMASKVRRIYDARSKIVHGKTSKKTKNAIDSGIGQFDQSRQEATAMLRFVIDRLLKHPRYLDPKKIDDELMLGSRPDRV